MTRLHALLWLVLFLGALLELAVCTTGSIGYCRAVSRLGDETVYMLIGIMAYSLLSGTLGIRLVSGLALTSSIVVALKVFTGLPRPPGDTWLVEASGPAFPSGHAALSSAFWTIVALYAKSLLVAVVGAVHTAAVSVSRLVLNVHYPRDVVGGVIVGVAAAAVAYMASARRSAASAAMLLGLAGLPLTAAALAADPAYGAAARLTGINMGLVAAGAALARMSRVRESLETRTLQVKLLSLAVSLAALAAALILEEIGLLAGVAGFAFFTAVTASSRPLAVRALGLRRPV